MTPPLSQGVGLAANFITVKVRSQYPYIFTNISMSKILNSSYTCMLKYLGRNVLMSEIYFELHKKNEMDRQKDKYVVIYIYTYININD